MTYREILLAFAEKYPRSVMRAGGKPLRLRAWEERYPEITRSAESMILFLESMEYLERQGILRLGWKGRKKGEKLAWAELADPHELYLRLNKILPDELAKVLELAANQVLVQAEAANSVKVADFFHIVADNANKLVDTVEVADIEDLFKLLSQTQHKFSSIPVRSLSIRLFDDSKRLERLLPLAQKIARLGNRPDLVVDLPSRSYPTVWIAGTIEFIPTEGQPWTIQKGPLGLSFALVQELKLLRLRAPVSRRVLSIENKETFYALCSSSLPFDAYVYCGGWPNRAVRLALTLLRKEGCTIYHAGDLDADGIAILGELHRLVDARPFGMNVQTFDRYLPHARNLDQLLLRRFAHIPEDVRQIDGISPLIDRIIATGKAVEQEIIDYEQENPNWKVP